MTTTAHYLITEWYLISYNICWFPFYLFYSIWPIYFCFLAISKVIVFHLFAKSAPSTAIILSMKYENKSAKPHEHYSSKRNGALSLDGEEEDLKQTMD